MLTLTQWLASLAGSVLFIAALALITAMFMRFLHKEFDWNPLSRRKQS